MWLPGSTMDNPRTDFLHHLCLEFIDRAYFSSKEGERPRAPAGGGVFSVLECFRCCDVSIWSAELIFETSF